MSWLITGAGGMLGTEMAARLDADGESFVAATRHDLDVRDASAVADAVTGHRFVVNCAGWTAVDDAETHEPEALALNGTAVATLAQACKAAGATLLQVSTDYVLRGDGTSPYPEDAPTGPINAYGRTKLAGELAARGHYIVRTAWLYGAHGPNFVTTMARLAAQRDTLDVVDDQHGQPTWTADLAAQVVLLARSNAPRGIYHATNAGGTTWYGLAREVFTHLGFDPSRVKPTSSDKFPRPAPRPSYSVLGHDAWLAAGLPPMRDWHEALAAYHRTRTL
jgi:dTDP-4-dehydrorhamnose reductase